MHPNDPMAIEIERDGRTIQLTVTPDPVEMKMIDDGVLQSWFADSAAARQLGIDPTGHAIRGPGGGPRGGCPP